MEQIEERTASVAQALALAAPGLCVEKPAEN
jgi:hypothetical protein